MARAAKAEAVAEAEVEPIVDATKAKKIAKDKELEDGRKERRKGIADKVAKLVMDDDLVGKMVRFTEKDGNVAPAIVLGVRDVSQRDEIGNAMFTKLNNPVEKTLLMVLVFSKSQSSQPYRADLSL